MMASLVVGQSIRIKGPKGAFVYTPNMVRHFGMIAGGTGITPMLQIIRAIVRGRATGDKTQVDLLFANVTRQDILLKEDLDAVVADDAGIRIHYVLDKPDEDWTGGVGFVTGEMIQVCTNHVSAIAFLQPVLFYFLLTLKETAPRPRLRCQAAAVRPSPHGLWPEEGCCCSRLREGQTRQQAC